MPLAALVVVVLLSMWAYPQPQTVQVWSSSEDMKQTLTQGPSIPLEPAGKLGKDRVIKLYPRKTYQSILGMGASFERTTCYSLFKLGPEKMTETIEKLVDPQKGIGFTRKWGRRASLRMCGGNLTGVTRRNGRIPLHEWTTYTLPSGNAHTLVHNGGGFLPSSRRLVRQSTSEKSQANGGS
jgi:hypothetical protein